MTARAATAGKVGREHTADLAARLKGRADARAARSVEDPLTGPPGTATASPESSPAPSPAVAAKGPSPAAQQLPAPLNTAPSSVVQVLSSASALSGSAGKLENSGEPIRKLTLELPRPLVDAIASWELAEATRTGRRVYRERMIDLALAAMPDDLDEVIAHTRDLPQWLVSAPTEQVGTRLRESVHLRLQLLRPALRVNRVRGVYLREIYAAEIYRYMLALGALDAEQDPPSTEESATSRLKEDASEGPSNRETENR